MCCPFSEEDQALQHGCLRNLSSKSCYQIVGIAKLNPATNCGDNRQAADYY